MGRIAVFDSGLGSISLVRPIRQIVQADLVYLADQKSYPYGTKSRQDLREAVGSAILLLKDKFSPDVIVVGSNTPSLLVPELLSSNVIGVLPPITKAVKVSKGGNIAVLATRSVASSAELQEHIKNTSEKKTRVYPINASQLVDLVESAKFISSKSYCTKVISDILGPIFGKYEIDTATLSSTHLPLLLPILECVYPNIKFLDPAKDVAIRAAKLAGKPSKYSKLEIYTTGAPAKLESHLAKMGMDNKVSQI